MQESKALGKSGSDSDSSSSSSTSIASASERQGMTERIIVNELAKLDLGSSEARVLFTLMIHPNSTGIDLAKHTGIARTEIYRHLANLRIKGVVRATLGKPKRYYSLSYVEAVEHLISIKNVALRSISENKNKYQGLIDSMANRFVQNTSAGKEFYEIMIGEETLVAQLHKMISKTKEELHIQLGQHNHQQHQQQQFLTLLHRHRLLEELDKKASKGVIASIRTSSEKTRDASWEKFKEKGIRFEVTASLPEITGVISDNNELIMLLDSSEDSDGSGSRFRFIHSNSQSMLKVFLAAIHNSK